MNDTGKVCKKTVLEVLQAHGVGVSKQEGATDGTMVLAKGEILETRVIPDEVGKKLLHYFERRFKVPLHHFYNPLMAPEVESNDKAS
jgi:hypothetical protein